MPYRESSPSQRQLAAILEANGKPARLLRELSWREGAQPIHRTKLWFYATGRGKPSVETAAFIERVTDGQVKANGWGTDSKVEHIPAHGSSSR